MRVAKRQEILVPVQIHTTKPRSSFTAWQRAQVLPSSPDRSGVGLEGLKERMALCIHIPYLQFLLTLQEQVKGDISLTSVAAGTPLCPPHLPYSGHHELVHGHVRIPQHRLDLIFILPGQFPQSLGFSLRLLQADHCQPFLPAMVMRPLYSFTMN